MSPLTSQSASYYDRGLLSLQEHNPSRAIELFTKAMESLKYRLSALYMRSFAYEKLDNMKSAAEDLTTMIQDFDQKKVVIESRHLDVFSRAAHLYLKLKDYPKAISYTLKGLHATLGKKESADFLCLSATIYLQLERLDLAKAELHKVFFILGEDASFHPDVLSLLKQIPADSLLEVKPTLEEPMYGDLPDLSEKPPSIGESEGPCIMQ